MFKQVVRDPAATSIFYKNLETAMYRARREIKPHISGSAAEFQQHFHYQNSMSITKVRYKWAVAYPRGPWPTPKYF